MDRLQAFINQKLENENFLQDLQSQESSKKVSVRILRNVAGENQNSKFDNLRQRIIIEKSTLFYIVHDEGIVKSLDRLRNGNSGMKRPPLQFLAEDSD